MHYNVKISLKIKGLLKNLCKAVTILVFSTINIQNNFWK